MSKSASVWNIIKKIFTWILVVVAVVVMIFTIVSVTTFDRNDRNVFGLKAFIVLSDSMSATDFDAGDVVVVNGKVDPTTLKPGDIIAYTSQNPENFGETVTHMIRTAAVSPEGDPGFITYGTTTNTDDETVVTYPYINGKYVFRLPKVGTFFFFLKTTPGYIVCILVPFLLLIGMQGVNCIQLFRRYKKEQMEEIEKEKSAVDAERQRSLDMMAELEALKLQLAQQKAGIAPAEASAPQAEEEFVEMLPVMETEPETAPVSAPVQRPAATAQRPATSQRPATAAQRPATASQRPASARPVSQRPTAPAQPKPAADYSNMSVDDILAEFNLK